MNLNDQSCAKERTPTDFRNYSIFNTEQIENAICHESKLKKCESIFRDKVNEFHCERRNGRESLKNMNHQPSRQVMKTCFDNDAVRPLKAFPRSRGTPKLVFPFTKDPKTPLAGCPKGLLITTERPRSGETYRHRINVDVMRTFDAGISKEKLGNNESSLHKRNIERNQERDVLLVELENMKREREELVEENERLLEELENRNKVIDHLVDFMRSHLPNNSEQWRTNHTVREPEEFDKS